MSCCRVRSRSGIASSQETALADELRSYYYQAHGREYMSALYTSRYVYGVVEATGEYVVRVEEGERDDLEAVPGTDC